MNQPGLETRPGLMERFIAQGILERCHLCPEWRKIEAALVRPPAGITMAVVADTRLRNAVDGLCIGENSSIQLSCECCQGTGFKLTDDGRRMMALIALWLPKVQSNWLEEGGEIPF